MKRMKRFVFHRGWSPISFFYQLSTVDSQNLIDEPVVRIFEYFYNDPRWPTLTFPCRNVLWLNDFHVFLINTGKTTFFTHLRDQKIDRLLVQLQTIFTWVVIRLKIVKLQLVKNISLWRHSICQWRWGWYWLWSMFHK